MIRRDNKLIFLTDSFIWFPFLNFELFLSLMNDRSISSCNQPDLSACMTSTRAARAARSTDATTVTIPPELAQLAMAKAVARDMSLEQFVQDAIRRMAELPDPWELFADLAIRLLVRLHELSRKSERHCALDPVVLDRVLLIDRGQIVFETVQRPHAIGVNQLDDCSHPFGPSVSLLLQEKS